MIAENNKGTNHRNKNVRITNNKSSLDSIWRAYKKSQNGNSKSMGDTSLRNSLMRVYSYLPIYQAERIHLKLPPEVDINDLTQAGYFGLNDAIKLYEPRRGIRFEAYGSTRVWGAIIDELRRMDWIPRLVRKRTSKLENIKRELQSTYRGMPTKEEMIKILDIDEHEFDKIRKDGHIVEVVSLDRKWYETDSGKETREVDAFPDNSQNPFIEVQKKDLKEFTLRGFSKVEKLLITLYYHENMTMESIGSRLGLTESRISQMHSSILTRLKEKFVGRETEFIF